MGFFSTVSSHIEIDISALTSNSGYDHQLHVSSTAQSNHAVIIRQSHRSHTSEKIIKTKFYGYQCSRPCALAVCFHDQFPYYFSRIFNRPGQLSGGLEWLVAANWSARFPEPVQLLEKIFAVAFGMGVVSGIVMSYQFGTNWSVFANKVGPVLGPLMGYEVLSAFFLKPAFWA